MKSIVIAVLASVMGLAQAQYSLAPFKDLAACQSAAALQAPGTYQCVPPPVAQAPVTVVVAAAPVTPPAQPSTDALAPIAGTAVNVLSSGASISAPVIDAAGRAVTTTRITKTGSMIYGGVRAERAWTGTKLQPGRDYWMAFAVMLKPGEAVGSGDGTMLIFQTHTPASGATTPDISLNLKGSTKQLFWTVAYNTKPSNTWKYVGGSNPDTEKESDLYTGALFPAGQWYRAIVHYRPGYLASHLPKLEVWTSLDGGAWTQVVNSTGFNTYNSLDGPSYPRIGPYKWSDSAWGTPAQSFLFSPLYFGEGANLIDAAKASLANW